MKKRWVTILVSVLVLIYLIPFLFMVSMAISRYITVYKNPLCYPGSIWTSEDGAVSFFVEEKYSYGTIDSADGLIEFEITSGLDGKLSLFPPEKTSNEAFEDWLWEYQGDSKFIAIVEKSTYFEVGTEIVFYRTPLQSRLLNLLLFSATTKR